MAAAVGRGAGGGVNVSVVGAGVMGLAAARAIAQRGHDVTVYEQFELNHTRGSSHGTSRIFRLSYPDEYWVRLARRAYELWRDLERESGMDLLVLYGLLDAQLEPDGLLTALTAVGVRYEELSGAQARRRYGTAYDDAARLIYTPDAGISLADSALDAFADGARAAGAEIRERTRVDSLADVPGDVVVVTAGGWAPKLLEAADIELDARPTRETVAYYASEPIPSVIEKLEGKLDFFALTAPGVGLKAGLHRSGKPTDPDDDPGPDEEIVSTVSDWVAQRFPHVDPSPLRAETCIYTNVEDEGFVCERRGRYVVGSACSGHGFKFAPAVGEILADQL
jgi:sarcosine oxidase